MKTLRPFIFMVAFVLIVGMACSFGNDATDIPTEPPIVEQPTDVPVVEQPTEPAATDEPAAPAEPTATEEPAAPVAEEFFTEEFDQDLSESWSYEVTGTDIDKGSMTVDDGSFVVKLEGKDLFAYAEYLGYEYEDVRIETSASNRGKNTLDVVLICRASDEGWYEARIGSDGLYWINAFDAIGIVRKGTNQIINGGSKHIKTGREENIYAFSCVGNKLTLEINGFEEKSIKDSKYKFAKGTVALGLQSYNVLPIIMNFGYFTVSQP